jgi:hypothetical protein
MIDLADMIQTIIKERVNTILSEASEIPDVELCETDNLGEVLEKLIIVHIRMWMLEDYIQTVYENDKEVADVKRKLDICFKQKRPKLVQAVNKLVDNSIRFNKSLVEDSVKAYKNYAK